MKNIVFLFVAATMLFSASMLFSAVHFDAPAGEEFVITNGAPMSAPGLVGPGSSIDSEGFVATSLKIKCYGPSGSCYAFDEDMRGITLGSIENIPQNNPPTQEMEAETEEIIVNP